MILRCSSKRVPFSRKRGPPRSSSQCLRSFYPLGSRQDWLVLHRTYTNEAAYGRVFSCKPCCAPTVKAYPVPRDAPWSRPATRLIAWASMLPKSLKRSNSSTKSSPTRLDCSPLVQRFCNRTLRGVMTQLLILPPLWLHYAMPQQQCWYSKIALLFLLCEDAYHVSLILIANRHGTATSPAFPQLLKKSRAMWTLFSPSRVRRSGNRLPMT